jgi:hypothetical protein
MDLIANDSTRALNQETSWPTYDGEQGWLNHFLLEILTGWSKWHVFLTIIVALITYDQGSKSSSYIEANIIADMMFSHVHQEEGRNCRTSIQDSIHGTFYSSTTP